MSRAGPAGLCLDAAMDRPRSDSVDSGDGERRVVTVVFCDVTGSTSLAERLDPEDWAEIMNAVFERIIEPVYRYGGTVTRLMGDSILAMFGAPEAHEDDPERAILAALGMIGNIESLRQELADRGLDFAIRVGVNTGLVVVGQVGSALRTEYTAMGDAVMWPPVWNRPPNPARCESVPPPIAWWRVCSRSMIWAWSR